MNRPIASLATVAITTAIILCLLPFATHAASQQQAQPTPAQSARETFADRCSTCHGEHGEISDAGASLNVPDLRSSAIQRNSDAVLRRFIREGKGNMPSFARDFSDSEIDQLILLVRSFANQAKAADQNSPSPAK